MALVEQLSLSIILWRCLWRNGNWNWKLAWIGALGYTVGSLGCVAFQSINEKELVAKGVAVRIPRIQIRYSCNEAIALSKQSCTSL